MTLRRAARAAAIAWALGAPPTAGAVDVALNGGAIEVLSLPGPRHGGLYPYVGISWAVALGRLTLIPGLSLESSVDTGHAGLVGSVVLDFPVGDHFGLDLDVAVIHDEPGLQFRESAFFVGGGGGASFLVGPWIVSPYLNFFRGLQTHDWSVVPGINLARPL